MSIGAEPVLKWVGGKRQLLDDLHKRVPSSYGQYHEPMVGGGALLFDLVPVRGTINDRNPRLVNFYEQVRDRPEALISLCQTFREPEASPDPERPFSDTVEQFYYQQRKIFNRRPRGERFDSLEEAALLLYLNRTCFNGLYRENADGEFNASKGRYANPDWVRAEQIRAASEVLQDIEILNDDFTIVRRHAQEGDLVYFDPPYEPMSPDGNFTQYNADGFGRSQQNRLLSLVKELDTRGVKFILSNSGIMYDLYDDAGFSVETVGARRSINRDGDNRGEVDEIIVTNIPRS